MKVTFNADDILPKLLQANSVINPKNALPILDDILIMTFRGSDDTIGCSIMSCDGDVWLTQRCDVVETETDAGVAMAIKAKDLVSTIRSLTGRVITFEPDEMLRKVDVDYINGQITLPCDNPDEFPKPIISKEDRKELILNSEPLTDAIKAASVTIGNDVIRPIVNGIHFDFYPDRMEAFSTTLSSMTKYIDRTVKCSDEEKRGVTFPSKLCSLSSHILSKNTGDIKVSFDASTVIMSNREFRVVSRLQEGKYPNCDSVIPKDNPIRVSVGKDTLIDSLKRITPLSDTSSQQIVFTFEEHSLTVSAEDTVNAKFASERITCDHDGEPFVIGFKGSLMISLLQNIPCENVVIEMLQNTRPVLLVPETQPEGVEHTHLLMPMLINQATL